MVEAFRSRRLDNVEFPYVYLDATYLKVRNSVSQVASMTMVVATGVAAAWIAPAPAAAPSSRPRD